MRKRRQRANIDDDLQERVKEYDRIKAAKRREKLKLSKSEAALRKQKSRQMAKMFEKNSHSSMVNKVVSVCMSSPKKKEQLVKAKISQHKVKM